MISRQYGSSGGVVKCTREWRFFCLREIVLRTSFHDKPRKFVVSGDNEGLQLRHVQTEDGAIGSSSHAMYISAKVV